VAGQLPGAVDDPRALDGAQARHVAECLRCQADLAHYRRLRRVMGSMRPDRVAAPSGVVADVVSLIDEAIQRRARHRAVGRRAAYVSGLAAATAAGVGGVLLLATRRRPA
jgi:hypothetical protein